MAGEFPRILNHDAGAMHNPGHPVRGGPDGPGGEMFRLKGLPQHCPGRPGWEGLQGQQRSSDHVHSLDRAGITGHLQPQHLPYMAGHPPKDNSAGSAQSTLTPLHTQTTPVDRNLVLHTPTTQRRGHGQHHLTCTSTSSLHLPLTSPSLKTSSLDPEPSNDLSPRFNHRLSTTYRKALPYISLPLSTY